MKGYISDEYASDEDEIVSEEQDHASIDSSSSDEEIDTKGQFTDIMKSKNGKNMANKAISQCWSISKYSQTSLD